MSFGSTVEPLLSGHLGTASICPDYRGVLISEVRSINTRIDQIWLNK